LPENKKKWNQFTHSWRNAGGGGWRCVGNDHYDDADGGLSMAFKKNWCYAVRDGLQSILMVRPEKEEVWYRCRVMETGQTSNNGTALGFIEQESEGIEDSEGSEDSEDSEDSESESDDDNETTTKKRKRRGKNTKRKKKKKSQKKTDSSSSSSSSAATTPGKKSILNC